MMDGEVLAILLLIAHGVLVILAAVVVSANRRPSAAIAWLLAVVFLPVLALIAFLLVGRTTLPPRRRADQAFVTARMRERVPSLAAVGHRDEWPDWLPGIVAMTERLGALPMVGGNTVDLIEDYVGSFDAMIAEIDRAQRFVHVEFYILVLDDTTRPFFDALARAAERGVDVRVLSDHLAGFMNPGRKATMRFLAAHRIHWHGMLPLRPLRGQWQRPDLRNHRKLVVVDGLVGFTGSQNLVDASYNKRKNLSRGLHWLELMVRIDGPAVRELDAVFVTDWFSESRELLPIDETPVTLGGAADGRRFDVQVLPSGPSFDAENNLKLFAALLHKAERRISITSPYFVPEESIMLALATAAARGVEVELFASEVGDQALVYHAQRSYYEALLRSGVRVYLYRSPTVLHSKHFSIDDDVAIIGSSNMDIRSFSLNMEVSVLVHGREAVDRLRVVEDHYRAQSSELSLAEWRARPVLGRIADNAARLTSALQ
ncbi:cardiolipin synthase [Leifsonia sp. NCR5]|uniref:cardiolipin synthase n=1 Tax=Leifsonia sp. NCR5 TaxID=1978342 RepID=UPI001179B27A|nr:cardiolipin synthase [Leifsonia sp. NCR5]